MDNPNGPADEDAVGTVSNKGGVYKKDHTASSALDAVSNVNRGEEEHAPVIHGVVTLQVKQASKIVLPADASLRSRDHLNFYVAISVRTLTKKTRTVLSSDMAPLFNQRMHMPVSIVKNPAHPFNVIQVQLFCYHEHNPFHHVSVGSFYFHLFEVIRLSNTVEMIVGKFDLIHCHHVVGEIEMELCFCYGMYGYGNSSQVHVQLSERQDIDVEGAVRQSLFPRVPPPDDQLDEETHTLLPMNLPHPEFIPFAEETHLGPPVNIANTPSVDLPRVSKKLTNLPLKFERYMSFSSRSERLVFLKQEILTRKMRTEQLSDNDGRDKKTRLSSDDLNKFVFSHPLFKPVMVMSKTEAAVDKISHDKIHQKGGHVKHGPSQPTFAKMQREHSSMGDVELTTVEKNV